MIQFGILNDFKQHHHRVVKQFVLRTPIPTKMMIFMMMMMLMVMMVDPVADLDYSVASMLHFQEGKLQRPPIVALLSDDDDDQ